MKLSKAQKKELAKKIGKKKPKVVVNKRVEKVNKKKVVVWNFKPNDLVWFKNCVALLVSDKTYYTERLEENCFYILHNNVVMITHGKNLRKIN